jgi:hypothetical protein
MRRLQSYQDDITNNHWEVGCMNKIDAALSISGIRIPIQLPAKWIIMGEISV